ncbi:MAG: enoyl-CoA hydratase-related protein [Acidobacteria bacterium]|nr:enoyl-CoA hydratase-related protein [Acidobacteriota bacterium]MCZ6768829.1 enoyl-CoA hydratase-related protein [Acidobacteriota bacterium]MCZ6878224.1 enoyl-CoA hydratase-related protein [Acidobacteriota bacterium]
METQTEEKLVEYRVEEGIAIFELNNPPANAYDHEMMRELDEAILKARFDENVHVIVVRGQGDRFFCAGANVKDISERSSQYRYNFGLHGNEVLCRLENTPKLVIAALNGRALGGGLEIALACDIRLAKKDAGGVGLPEINLGLIPGMGGTQRLARLIGNGRALELMATGRTVNFEEALEMGIINHIYEKDGFFEDVLVYARQFVPPNKAARSVGCIKRAVKSGFEMSLVDGLALERELLQQAFDSEDAAEGMKSFMEKRMPAFKGR